MVTRGDNAFDRHVTVSSLPRSRVSRVKTSCASVPVLIVGGGPVGLAVAIGLRHFGVDCLLVEQHDSTLDFPKGRAVNARAMEILRQWDVEDRVRAVGLPAEETSFGFLGETLLASEFTLIPFVEPSAGAMSPCDRIVCS